MFGGYIKVKNVVPRLPHYYEHLSIVKSNKNVHYRQDLPVSCPVPTYYSTNYHTSEEK
jgi:hypothetical protein